MWTEYTSLFVNENEKEILYTFLAKGNNHAMEKAQDKAGSRRIKFLSNCSTCEILIGE